MDGREGGYIKFFRSVESSEDFIGLRPDQCWVAIRLVQLANFRPGFSRFRGQAIPVGRGELAHTLETISERTGATIKVVRTTVHRLLQSSFLGTRTGMVAGTPYRILIIRNYDRYQADDESPGMVAGTATGSDRACDGLRQGTGRALREEGKKGRREEELPYAAASAAGAVQAPGRAGNGRAAPKPTDPRHHPMQLALVAAFQRARQVKYGFGKQDPRAVSEILALSGGDEIEACRRFEAGLARGAYPRCDSIADLAKHWNAYANGVAAPAKSNGGIRGHERRWWEDLDAEQRGEFMRQKHELAPELDAAPLDVAGEVGRERRDVQALLDRWRAVAERRATA